MRAQGGQAPRRNCKIDGKRYLLAGVGIESPFRAWTREHAEQIREAFGVTYGNGYRFIPESLMVSKLATPMHVEKWPEVSLVESRGRMVRPYLFWIREDAAPTFDAWNANR